MGKLNGKMAIVTGGGRGIGRAIVEAYLEESAYITLTAAREKAEIKDIVREAGPEARGGNVVALVDLV